MDENKRKTPPLPDERPSKRNKIPPLKAAIQKLDGIIETEPDKRIYQIQRWNHAYEGTYITFEVGTIDQICDRYMRDDNNAYVNILEYYFGVERCPLVFDIEWYNPQQVARQTLEDNIGHVVDMLIAFISVALISDDGISLTRDNVCVEETCSDDGLKASFHIKVHDLIFPNMVCDMQSFVFYFCSWMHENKDDMVDRIPEIFFHQTPTAQKMIKEHDGDDVDTFLARIKSKCEKEWRDLPKLKYGSCGVDTKIYSSGRAFRIAGACKPTKPNENPRFLRPCKVTNWWATKLSSEYLEESVLRTTVPLMKYRREWARASLLMLPTPGAVNVRVPPPRGVGWKEPRIENDYRVLPPPPPGSTRAWRWILNTDQYPHPDGQQRLFYPNATRHNIVSNVTRIGDRYDDGADGYIYTFEGGKMRLYEKREGRWHNRTDDGACVDIDQLRRRAFVRTDDVFIRYWNDRKNMQLDTLEHMEATGYDAEKSTEEYTKTRDEHEAAKLIEERISVLYKDDRTTDMMFSGPNITLDPQFNLITARGEIIRLGDIIDHTAIFCPKHEMDFEFRSHSASAFVSRDRLGRRFISCSSNCGATGMSMKETWQGDDEMTWENFGELYGEPCVEFITEEYFELEHLLRLDDDDNRSEHSEYSIIHRQAYPKIYIGISNMGTGKTTLLRRLARDDLGIAMREMGFHVMHQPSMLSISPRRDLARYTAIRLGLVNYNDVHGTAQTRNELLCEQQRLSICINSLRRLKDRHDGYDIIILDEFATTSLSLITEHMLSYVSETMDILESLMKKSKIIIMLAADGNPRMVKTLLPFLDWEDPANLRITINKGGIGGIIGHELYISDDLIDVCSVLKKYVLDGKNVYVPTNRRSFAKRLEIFCKEHLGLGKDEILVYDKHSPASLKGDIMEGAERWLGYTCLYCDGERTYLDGEKKWRCEKCDRDMDVCLQCDEGKARSVGEDMWRCSKCEKDMKKPYARCKVFIATPAFGVGFSVAGNLFDITIAFFFIIPRTVLGNVQHLARVRGVNENTIICYYESRTSNQKTFSHKMPNARERLKKALGSYEDLIVSTDRTTFNLIPQSPLRAFAIECELQDRLSEWYADSMFINNVTLRTGTKPYLLQSWLCNKGVGPIIILPELNDEERRIIRRPGKYIITTNPPMTWGAMYDILLRQGHAIDISRDEAEFVEVSGELPVPYGLLKENERRKMFVNYLDRIWHALEVLTAGDDGILLSMEYKRYTTSQAVSTITRETRFHQQYQLFEAWSRFVVPYITQQHQRTRLRDHGMELFTYMMSMWQISNEGDEFHFDVKPDIDNIKDVTDEISELLHDLREDDADVDKWFNIRKMNELVMATEDEIVKIYAKIISKGFRRFLGMSNVCIRRLRNGSVRVTISGLKRLISLACVRRILLGCDIVFQFDEHKFPIVSKYRDCEGLTGLIPSDNELSIICGFTTNVG
jgi:Origin of replication binding protein